MSVTQYALKWDKYGGCLLPCGLRLQIHEPFYHQHDVLDRDAKAEWAEWRLGTGDLEDVTDDILTSGYLPKQSRAKTRKAALRAAADWFAATAVEINKLAPP